MILWNLRENLGATSEIRINFRGEFQNNSLERVETWKIRNTSFVNHKIFIGMEVATVIG